MTRFACLVGLVLFAAGLVSADDTYTLKLERGSKKGDKFVVAGAATQIQSQKVTQGGVAAPEQKSYASMTFEGEVEILEVGADGYATKATCTVHQCALSTEEGVEAKEAVAEGTVLTQTIVDGKKTVTSDKGELAAEVQALLDEFLPCDTKDPGGDADACFGTAEPKKVGDVWPIHSDIVAQGLGEKMGSKIDPANVKGDAKLAEVVEHEGMQCTALHMEMQVLGIVPPGFPEAAEVKKSEMNIAMDVALPVDASMRQVAERMEMTWEMAATVQDPNGGKVEMEISVHNSKEVESMPVK